MEERTLSDELLTILFCVPLMILKGHVLSVLWGWFLVPSLGVPALNLVPAIGLSIIMELLTVHQLKISGKKLSALENAGFTAFIYLFILVNGYIFSLFM